VIPQFHFRRVDRDAALKAIGTTWSHIFYPVKSDTAGKWQASHSIRNTV